MHHAINQLLISPRDNPAADLDIADQLSAIEDLAERRLRRRMAVLVALAFVLGVCVGIWMAST